MEKNQLHRAFPSLLVVTLLVALLFSPVFSAPPNIKNPYEIVEATIEGGSPESVDPAWAYDPASGELIFNVYETLLTFNGEHVDDFLPQLATEWSIENITGAVSPEGLAWFYRYYFRIRTNVKFHGGSTLMPEDVEYSFERAMVKERLGGPVRMFFEPLLNAVSADDLDNLSDPEGIIRVGRMIDHAVESNETHMWFNLAFPGVYAPLLKILCQTWSSVVNRQWVRDYIITVLNRTEWDGNWGDYNEWIAYRQPEVSALDSPTPVMDGTGPFRFEALDFDNGFWSVVRNPDYWRGWPADWPTASGVKPAGYLTRLKIMWRLDWPTRREMFLNGDIDFCSVPRSFYTEILGKNGVRQTDRLPTLSVTALFFAFHINETSPYGQILPKGTFNDTGIPSDFFANADWGTKVRKGFAFAFDYDTYINQTALGEGQHPATAILPSVSFHDPTVKGYTYNLTRAAEELQQIPGLWDAGFTLTLPYQISSRPQYLAEIVKTRIESLNPKFHIELMGLAWSDYLEALSSQRLPIFCLGWLADYPDAHGLAFEFYHSSGAFPKMQAYSNPQMDALVDAGLREPDSAARATIYRDLQTLAIEDCPSMMLLQPLSRHFERDWIVGWYYNPSSPGIYGYNLWKWYYIPHALSESTAYPISNTLPSDVDYSGQVNIIDITLLAKAFGSSFGPTMHSRWQFRADINNDREVNIIDLAAVAKYFRKTSDVWIPPT